MRSIPSSGNMNSDSVETEQETTGRYNEEDKLFVDVGSGTWTIYCLMLKENYNIFTNAYDR